MVHRSIHNEYFFRGSLDNFYQVAELYLAFQVGGRSVHRDGGPYNLLAVSNRCLYRQSQAEDDLGAGLCGRAFHSRMASDSARHFKGASHSNLVPCLLSGSDLCIPCSLLDLRCEKAGALGFARKASRIEYPLDLSASALVLRCFWQRSSYSTMELRMARCVSSRGIHRWNHRYLCHPDSVESSHATVKLCCLIGCGKPTLSMLPARLLI